NMADVPPAEGLSHVRIREALARVLASSLFVRSRRLSKYLSWLVERAIERADVTEHLIAQDVYERGADFDPLTDAIVREETYRLRRKLQEYYAAEGQEDPLRIEIPKGSYIPVFTGLDAAREPDPTAETGALPRPASRQIRRWPLAAVAMLLAVVPLVLY